MNNECKSAAVQLYSAMSDFSKSEEAKNMNKNEYLDFIELLCVAESYVSNHIDDNLIDKD